MMRLQVRISIGNICAKLGILLIMMLLLVYMNNAVGNTQYATGILQVGIAITAMALIATIAYKRSIHLSRFLIVAGLLCGFMVIVSCVCNGLTASTIFPYILKFNLWLVIYILGYIAVKHFSCEKFVIFAVCISFAIMTGIFLFALQQDFSIKNKNYVITAVYYLLCCMPFLFEVKIGKLRNILLAVVVICVSLSFKRSALLVLAVVTLVLVACNLRYTNRKKITYGILGGCVALIALLLFAETFFEENGLLSDITGIWIGRFGEGNSRNSIQKEAFQMFLRSDIASIILGHGYDAVLQDSIYSLSAHNDYLEMLYDYGIIGFSLYAMVIILLLKEVKRIGTNNHLRREGYVASLTVFLVASIPSHMLTYSTYFLLISLYWGFAHGLAAKNE